LSKGAKERMPGCSGQPGVFLGPRPTVPRCAIAFLPSVCFSLVFLLGGQSHGQKKPDKSPPLTLTGGGSTSVGQTSVDYKRSTKGLALVIWWESFDRGNETTNPGRMSFGIKYLIVGPLMRVVTIIHEAAHFVDKDIDHFASALPAPNGRALNGTNGTAHTHNYAQLTPAEAMKNAASYACFAIHMAKKADTRPTITQ